MIDVIKDYSTTYYQLFIIYFVAWAKTLIYFILFDFLKIKLIIEQQNYNK